MAGGWARRWTRAAAAAAVLLGTAAGTGIGTAAPTAAAPGTIGSPGPLTRVQIGDQLNCAVDHSGDTSPEWFGDTACGTLLATGGVLYGPASIPAGGAAQPRTPWTPVSQSAVTGTGSGTDPYRVVTVVAAGGTGLRLTETDSYVVGAESYRTDIEVANAGPEPITAILYRAGDCYLQNDDTGYGAVDPATGAVACSTTAAPGGRIEQLLPLTAGSRYYEAYYDAVWAAVGSRRPFPDSCDCAIRQDNGLGLSWDIALPAGASATYSSLLTFSPLGRVPLTITKTADAPAVQPGGATGYTITVTNPNIGDVRLTALTDLLGAGFGYRPGTTSGATTADPAVAGPRLTWADLLVPAQRTATVHFGVTAAAATGTYTDDAQGSATGYTVVGTGPTAPVVVAVFGAGNHPPVARGGAARTGAGIPVAITLAGADPDGDPVGFAVTGQPAHGRLAGSPPALTYTPAAGYTGADAIRFTASDGRAVSAPATVSVTVAPPPAVSVRPQAVRPGGVLTVDLAGFPAGAQVLLDVPGAGEVTVDTDAAGAATTTVVILRRDLAGAGQVAATAGAYQANADLVLQPPEWAPPFRPR